jgi:hypothetical protein
MNKAEIKDLYSEEIALLKRIQDYLKAQRQAPEERVERVTLMLLYRMYSCLYSAFLLTAAALKKGNINVFKLPIGIVLRCAFTDCLLSLYLQIVDIKRSCEELDLRTIEYANSLLDRRELYRDQVKSIEIGLEDDFIDNMWEMTMEDNFLHLLAFDETKKGLELTKRSVTQLRTAGFSSTKSLSIKEQKDFLVNQKGLKTVATRL